MHFEVWAPEADSVVLEAADVRCAMELDAGREGWWTAGAEQFCRELLTVALRLINGKRAGDNPGLRPLRETVTARYR